MDIKVFSGMGVEDAANILEASPRNWNVVLNWDGEDVTRVEFFRRHWREFSGLGEDFEDASYGRHRVVLPVRKLIEMAGRGAAKFSGVGWSTSEIVEGAQYRFVGAGGYSPLADPAKPKQVQFKEWVRAQDVKVPDPHNGKLMTWGEWIDKNPFSYPPFPASVFEKAMEAYDQPVPANTDPQTPFEIVTLAVDPVREFGYFSWIGMPLFGEVMKRSSVQGGGESHKWSAMEGDSLFDWRGVKRQEPKHFRGVGSFVVEYGFSFDGDVFSVKKFPTKVMNYSVEEFQFEQPLIAAEQEREAIIDMPSQLDRIESKLDQLLKK